MIEREAGRLTIIEAPDSLSTIFLAIAIAEATRELRRQWWIGLCVAVSASAFAASLILIFSVWFR
jgi:hypothetical protein